MLFAEHSLNAEGMNGPWSGESGLIICRLAVMLCLAPEKNRESCRSVPAERGLRINGKIKLNGIYKGGRKEKSPKFRKSYQIMENSFAVFDQGELYFAHCEGDELNLVHYPFLQGADTFEICGLLKESGLRNAGEYYSEGFDMDGTMPGDAQIEEQLIMWRERGEENITCIKFDFDIISYGFDYGHTDRSDGLWKE